jgi:hypothetical protein
MSPSEAGRKAAEARWGNRGSDAPGSSSQSSEGPKADPARKAFPGGFTELTEKEILSFERERLGPKMGEGWAKKSDADQEALAIAYRSQVGKVRVFEGTSTRVEVETWGGGLSDDEIGKQLGAISTLQKIAPVKGLVVKIGEAEFDANGLPASAAGFVKNGTETIHLRPSAVHTGQSGDYLMRMGPEPKLYALTHEYGHVLDKRSIDKASSDFDEVMGSGRLSTGISRYGQEESRVASLNADADLTKGREMFAEAWAGWVGSRGLAAEKPGVVQFFASKYGWGVGADGRSPTASFAKEAGLEFILYDTFTDEGAGFLTAGSVPGGVPLLKAMSPSEAGRLAANVRWGNRGEDPKAMPPKLQAAFDYATGSFTTPGPEAKALAELEAGAMIHAMKMGMSAKDVPYGDLTEVSLYGKAIIRRAYDKRDQIDRFEERSDADNEALATVMDDWRFGGQVMVKVPSDALDDIIAGRVKNQFDTDTSRGLYDPDVRAIAETAAHGLHPAAPASERPIYGFVGMPGSEHPYALDQYGDVTLVLKPSVKDKTTITLGDSLNQNATPVQMNGTASIRELSDAAGRNPFLDHGDVVAKGGRNQLELGETFMEAQIFGEIGLDQIARIVFRGADQNLNRDGVAMLREELEGSGVAVEIFEG